MLKTFLFTLATLCLMSTIATAQTVQTSFNNSDGFVTASTSNVTLTNGLLSALFSGGVQEQSFDGPAYNQGNEAYFFVNSGPTSFTGSFGRTLSGSTDVGTISFNTGVDTVSFFAADRAFGTPSLRVLDVNGAVLDTQSISATDNGLASALFSFDSSILGAQIGSIEFDNAGPAANPPYVIAIDSFSASVNAVPEPSSLLFCAAFPCAMVLRRRRS